MAPETAPSRFLRLERTVNTRDVGGYPTLDGLRTRWRVILRSDSLQQLSARGQTELMAYGVRTVVDLRHPREVAAYPNVFAAGDRADYVNLALIDGPTTPREGDVDRPLHTLESLYRGILDERQAQIRAFLDIVRDPARRTVLVHCTAGKDRTGILVALLLSLAGVPPAVIADDYALTAACLDGRWIADHRASVEARGVDWESYRTNLDCHPELMLRTLAYLDDRYGGIRPYLASLDLSIDEVDDLRASLVE